MPRSIWSGLSSGQAVLPVAFLLLASTARADDLPGAISRQLPPGSVVLDAVHGRLAGGAGDDYVVALGRLGDDPAGPIGGDTAAPARPLLLYRAATRGTYLLAGRNDVVVMRHNQGGQCDPFDPEQGLVMKGAYVTVQNEVACGNHWSDYITFRYDRTRGELLFSSEIYHSWKFNPSQAPDAEALVLDEPPIVKRGDPHRPVSLSAWKPST